MKEACLCWGSSTVCAWATTPSATSRREPSEASRPYGSCEYSAVTPLGSASTRLLPEPRTPESPGGREHYLSASLMFSSVVFH